MSLKITRRLSVPTGDILIVEGERGPLELLSIGDYGKDHNLKCDAMGLNKDLDHVEHTKMLPLSEKWVITISTQYGCSMNCNFCDVPKVGPGVNVSADDLYHQVLTGLLLHPEIAKTNRLNIHYARMGEPTWNPGVIEATYQLRNLTHKIHPVVSTMMPRKNKWLLPFLSSWMDLKNNVLQGNAGLQLSINSTSPDERAKMFAGNAMSLRKIADLMNKLPKPQGRKITLNFAVANYCINEQVLLTYFNPKNYIIKLTPMHKTHTALDNNIKTNGNYTQYYPYQEIEEKLKSVGFDVLVFIASEEEDLGRITCGNAILSGTLPEVEYQEIN